MARTKKDKFSDLPADFKDMMNSMKNEEILDRVGQIALDMETLAQAKEDDQDLLEKVEIAKEASAVYRDGFKMGKLKLKYAKRVLEDRGIDTTNVKVA